MTLVFSPLPPSLIYFNAPLFLLSSSLSLSHTLALFLSISLSLTHSFLSSLFPTLTLSLSFTSFSSYASLFRNEFAIFSLWCFAYNYL